MHFSALVVRSPVSSDNIITLWVAITQVQMDPTTNRVQDPLPNHPSRKRNPVEDPAVRVTTPHGSGHQDAHEVPVMTRTVGKEDHLEALVMSVIALQNPGGGLEAEVPTH